MLAAKAADEVERRGLFKGDLGSSRLPPEADDCSVCALGALNAASTGNPFRAPENFHTYMDVREALFASIPGRWVGITTWSDNTRTTAREVADTFRAVSVRLAEEGK